MASILIVDDDIAVLDGVTRLLEQAGYTTLRAKTGEQALALLSKRPNLVVLDLMLPGIDGLEVCRRIRQMTPYIPILMLSARDEITDKVVGLELGADEYVTKPFDPRELVARVRALLRFTQQRTFSALQDEQPLVCGPITLWPESRTVEVGGQPLELTPTLWALLEMLMRHRGRALGRETLLQHVWGHDFDGDARAVDTAVLRLRTQLAVHPAASDCIQTIRGFGYRLIAPNDTTRL